MQKYTYICWIHTDAMITDARNDKDAMIMTTQWITTQEEFFIKIFTSHFICKGSKRVTQGLRVRGSWRPNRTKIFWPLLCPLCCVFLVLLMLNRRPRGSLCWMMAFFIASYQHLLWTPAHQGPKPLRPGVTLPITTRLPPSPTQLQLNWPSNSTGTGTQLIRAPSVWCGFPYHISSITPSELQLHWLVDLNWVI